VSIILNSRPIFHILYIVGTAISSLKGLLLCNNNRYSTTQATLLITFTTLLFMQYLCSSMEPENTTGNYTYV